MVAKPYRIYTQAHAGAPVVTIAPGERIVSITAQPDGVNDVTIDIVAANLDVSDQITVLKSGSFGQDWQGALRGPGSVTFGNLNGGKYVVTTVHDV